MLNAAKIPTENSQKSASHSCRLSFFLSQVSKSPWDCPEPKGYGIRSQEEEETNLPSAALGLNVVREAVMEHGIPLVPHLVGGDVHGVVASMAALSRMADDVALDPDEVAVEALVGLALRVDHNHVAEEIPPRAGRVQSRRLAAQLK